MEHRQFACATLRERGCTHALIPDGDEIIEPELLHALTQIAASELAERVYVQWDTYWKTPAYVIRPREPFTPCMLLDLRTAQPTGGRNFAGGRSLLLDAAYGLVHHLSYVGPDPRIRRKIVTWVHQQKRAKQRETNETFTSLILSKHAHTSTIQMLDTGREVPVLCFPPPVRPDAAEATTPLSYNLTQRDIGLEALHCQDFDDLSTYLFSTYPFPNVCKTPRCKGRAFRLFRKG